jgi:hypothetical protein|tara:strand:+ start:18 stop:395 length:378 start_codon:yes stop_codon:yes gene_type:complete
MTTDPKKLSSSMRPLIESILKKAVAAGNISPKVLEQRIKDLDLIDAGKKPTGKKAGGLAEATAKLKAQGLKKGSQVKKKKKKKSFPDLNKDGKVTMKDILIGRGVIKKAKVGMQMKGTSPLIKKR